MNAATRRSPRWWQSRGLRRSLLLGILALLVVRIGLDLWAGHRVRTKIARLEAKYGSLAPSAGQPPEVPDADNRARLVKAAAALVMPGAPDEAARLISAIRSVKTLPHTAPVPDGLRKFLDANRESLRLVDEARGLRETTWNLDYETFEDTPPLLELRTLSNVTYLAARLAIDDGRPDEASRVLEGGLAVASSLSQEPMLVVQLIRIAVALEQLDGVKELIERSEPSAPALEALAGRLGGSREPDPLTIGLVGELRYSNAVLARLEDGRGGRDSPGWQTGFRTWALLLIGRPFMRLARARYLEETDALIEAQAGGRPLDPFDGTTRLGWLGQGFMSTTGLERAMRTGDEFVSALGAAELGVALRRYRLAHGAYPEELSALVPDYLPGVPIDPFTGQPPIYARQGEGFSLRAEPFADRPGSLAFDVVVDR